MDLWSLIRLCHEPLQGTLKRIECARPQVCTFTDQRSALYADPFAPDRKERGHCHWAEEKPDQSKRLQTANNSDQYQQER